MSYQIMQSSKYLDNNRWEWQVWIDAPAKELDQIDQVTWYLHKTFPKPVVNKTNRHKKFLLKQIGWGTFLLHAKLSLKNEQTIELTHQLNFDGAGADVTPRSKSDSLIPLKKQKKIFLSYGAEDAELASKMQHNLQKIGYRVQDIKDCISGMPIKLAQQKLMRESDLVMGLVTSDVASPYVLDNLNRAKQSNKAVVAVVSKDIKPMGLNADLSQISFAMESDDSELENLFEQLDNL